jgi:hypothetical protein
MNKRKVKEMRTKMVKKMMKKEMKKEKKKLKFHQLKKLNPINKWKN